MALVRHAEFSVPEPSLGAVIGSKIVVGNYYATSGYALGGYSIFDTSTETARGFQLSGLPISPEVGGGCDVTRGRVWMPVSHNSSYYPAVLTAVDPDTGKFWSFETPSPFVPCHAVYCPNVDRVWLIAYAYSPLSPLIFDPNTGGWAASGLSAVGSGVWPRYANGKIWLMHTNGTVTIIDPTGTPSVAGTIASVGSSRDWGSMVLDGTKLYAPAASGTAVLEVETSGTPSITSRPVGITIGRCVDVHGGIVTAVSGSAIQSHNLANGLASSETVTGTPTLTSATYGTQPWRAAGKLWVPFGQPTS